MTTAPLPPGFQVATARPALLDERSLRSALAVANRSLTVGQWVTIQRVIPVPSNVVTLA